MNDTMIIAEVGVNHNGQLDLALKLCEEAKKAGADVVKFQTWKTENVVTRHVSQPEYQTKNIGKIETQFDMLKRLELSYDEFRKIKTYCDKIGIIFASTADEMESLDFLISIGIPFIKVASSEIANIPYLRYIRQQDLPVILSTGMSTLEDIDISINALRGKEAKDITLLHCTTTYPCPADEVNLRAMLTMKNAFHLPAGYSDHTIGTDAAVAAAALGAKVIEKHFTLDKKMNGPDHIASTEPKEFKQLVEAIRNVEKMMGDGIKYPTNSEQAISKIVKKSIIASANIKKGDIFSESNICVKRSNFGISAKYWDLVIGKTAKKDYSFEEGIEFI